MYFSIWKVFANYINKYYSNWIWPLPLHFFSSKCFKVQIIPHAVLIWLKICCANWSIYILWFFPEKKIINFWKNSPCKQNSGLSWLHWCMYLLFIFMNTQHSPKTQTVTPLSQQPEASFFCIKGNPSYERDFNVPIVISSHATLDGPGTLPNIVRCIVNLTSLWLLPGDILQSPTCRIHKIYIHLCTHICIYLVVEMGSIKSENGNFLAPVGFFTYREKSEIKSRKWKKVMCVEHKFS